MLVIPTHVALAADDPELLRARSTLSTSLRMMLAGDDEAQMEGEYLASAPCREEDGAITYVHVFRVEICGSMHAIGVPAASDWWPIAQPRLAPRRTARRGRLRLVS